MGHCVISLQINTTRHTVNRLNAGNSLQSLGNKGGFTPSQAQRERRSMAAIALMLLIILAFTTIKWIQRQEDRADSQPVGSPVPWIGNDAWRGLCAGSLPRLIGQLTPTIQGPDLVQVTPGDLAYFERGWSEILKGIRERSHTGQGSNLFRCARCDRHYVASCSPG